MDLTCSLCMREPIHGSLERFRCGDPKPGQAADVTLDISKLSNTKSNWHHQINQQHSKENFMVAIPYITLIINTSIITKVFF